MQIRGNFTLRRKTGEKPKRYTSCVQRFAQVRPFNILLRAEREARSEFFCGLGEISVCAAQPDPTQPDSTQPDPTRPDPITLLRSLYLWNGLTDSRAVFFVRCHHSINFVFDRYRYPPVPATARGTSPSVTPQRLARLRSNLVCD